MKKFKETILRQSKSTSGYKGFVKIKSHKTIGRPLLGNGCTGQVFDITRIPGISINKSNFTTIIYGFNGICFVCVL